MYFSTANGFFEHLCPGRCIFSDFKYSLNMNEGPKCTK